MNEHGYINGIIGGAIIATASSFHLLLKGNLTGISGIFFNSIHNEDIHYNISFLLGMVCCSSTLKTFFDTKWAFEEKDEFIADCSFFGFVISGFLVGFGAKWANGCTSGHGVSGLPRFSKRSIFAVSVFLIFGMSFASFKYYIPFLSTDFLSDYIKVLDWSVIVLSTFISSLAGYGVIAGYLISKKEWDKLRDTGVAFVIGTIFGYGWLQGGMVSRHKVINFWAISKDWDITLLCVLLTAVGINSGTFYWIQKQKRQPVWGFTYNIPINKKIDVKLFIGAALFGIGWGWSGMCPGPAIMAFYAYVPQTCVFLAMIAAGQYSAFYSEKFIDDKMGGKNAFKPFNDM
ncbi:MAG: YeeE/YedE family protein [Mycoplasma sp.]